MGPEGGRSPKDPDLRRGMGRGGAGEWGGDSSGQGRGYRRPAGGVEREARTPGPLAWAGLMCAAALEAPSLVAQV